MCFRMLRQVIGSRERLLTSSVATAEGPLQGVDAHVSLQMLQSLESALALQDGADVGFGIVGCC